MPRALIIMLRAHLVGNPGFQGGGGDGDPAQHAHGGQIAGLDQPAHGPHRDPAQMGGGVGEVQQQGGGGRHSGSSVTGTASSA